MAGIYIHIPFCKKLCFYCDFYHVLVPKDTSGFTNALTREIVLRKDYLGEESVKTIYFGGGTPSIFSVSDLKNILSTIRREFSINDNNEITVELNPDDVSPGY